MQYTTKIQQKFSLSDASPVSSNLKCLLNGQSRSAKKQLRTLYLHKPNWVNVPAISISIKHNSMTAIHILINITQASLLHPIKHTYFNH